MKSALPIFAALLVETALGSPQAFQPSVLLSAGDPLQGGATVTHVRDVDIGADGDWVARVGILSIAGGHTDALVHGGAWYLGPGDQTANGERVVTVGQARIDDGRVFARVSVEASGAPTPPSTGRDRLLRDGAVLLREGDHVNASGLPSGSTVSRMRGFDIAGPHLLIALDVRLPSLAEIESVVRFDLGAAGLGAGDAVAIQGTMPGGLMRPIMEFLPSLAVARDGSHVTSLVEFAGSDGVTAGLYNGVAAFETGTQAPLAAGVWESVSPRVACAAGSGYIVGGSLYRMGQVSQGIVAGEGVIHALSGHALPALPTETVASFLSAEVALTDLGEPLFGVPLESGDDVLVLGDAVVLRTGDTAAGGQRVESIRYDDLGTLAVSPSGSHVLITVELEGGAEALLGLEHGIGVQAACAATPNSTGQVGSLDAFGSDSAMANDLTLRASGLPNGSIGYLLASRTAGYVPMPPGSEGTLCLGGAIGRYPLARIDVDTGVASQRVDLAALPVPHGDAVGSAGETWVFQFWHRDRSSSGGATTNFTSGLSITLR